MAKFEHTQDLTSINYMKTITLFCPLGNDYYTAGIEVSMAPGEYVMDYLDEENFFKELQGKKLIIEDLVNTVYEHIMYEYAPTYLYVSVKAYNATHFPVVVTKESM